MSVSVEGKSMMLNVKDVAVLLRCSVRHVERLLSAGQMPRCIRVGHARRWRRAEIERWIDAGCPARDAWKQKEGGRR